MINAGFGDPYSYNQLLAPLVLRLEIITKLIKDVIGDVYRDIWLKRNAWK